MIQIPSFKKRTQANLLKTLPLAKKFFMPMKAYKGAMNPLVKEGDFVKKYQLIAKSEGVFAMRMHAPVSGIVLGIQQIDQLEYLVIENDDNDTSLPIIPFDRNSSQTEWIAFLLEKGIEGSGGARFPTHLKYNYGDQRIETFIINAAECEPYLNADYALLKCRLNSILETIEIIQNYNQATEIVFGIEKHNKHLSTELQAAFKHFQLPLKIVWLPDEYPQGGELQLIHSITGKELRKGSVPAKSGVLVSNIGSIWAMSNALFEGKPYIERVVTISNQDGSISENYLVPLGTPVAHILSSVGLHWNLDNQIVILGGPMMGKAIQTLETPIYKGNGGLLLLDKPVQKKYNCIECGYCVDVCPQHLMPMQFARFINSESVAALQEYSLQDCIECGACAYVCPSDVPLMQSILAGKNILNR